MNNTLRKRVAVIMTVALCMAMCPCMGEEISAKTASPETEIQNRDAWEGEYAPWQLEEVIVELDENNTDENGCSYELQIGESDNTAKLSGIEVSQYKSARKDIILRVPDKVVKEGIEYTVREFAPKEKGNGKNVRVKIRFRIGSAVKKISLGWLNCDFAIDVHIFNEKYINKDGILFSRDKTELVRFNDEKYGADKVYVLPDTVTKIGESAFSSSRIKEVVLNNNITSIPYYTFKYSTLQTIDLKNVKNIGGYAFLSCKSLREVKINCENVQIEQYSFESSGLENIYLPPGTTIHDGFGTFSECRRLKTVIMGDSVQISGYETENFFNGDYELKTLILSEDIPEISFYMLAWCCSLRKLYIPDSVQSVDTMGLGTRGELTLYGKKGSAAEQYVDDNITFVDISEHEHSLKERTFFEYDSWGVKGKYCEECAYGTDFEIVNYDEDVKKEQMPESLDISDKCPKLLELDGENRDEQGLIYELDEKSRTAMVKAVDKMNPFKRLYFALPETVRKDGTTYILTTIGESPFSQARIVLVSDTVKEVRKHALSGITGKIVLGENVQEVDRSAFSATSGRIEVPESNHHFKKIGNVLYTDDGKEIIKYYDEDCIEKEFRIPTKITYVWDGAFRDNRHLDEIDVYNCGNMTIGTDAFGGSCSAEIVYGNGYTWYDDEDYIVEVNAQNIDANGWGYSLDGGTFTAELDSGSMLMPDDVSGDFEVRVPDKVRRDGKLYTVTRAYPSFHTNSVVSEDFYIRLYIGKYMCWGNYVYRGEGEDTCKVANYVHVENENNTSEQGSLFWTDGNLNSGLIQFCDENYDAEDSYTVPDKITYIGNTAFAKAKIRSVDVNKARSIGSDAFMSCPNLEEVIIREGVQISNKAFSKSPNLKFLYLPKDSMLTWGALGSSSLKVIVMDESTNMDGAKACFSDCESLRTVILPQSISEFSYRTFYRCRSLEKVYIPAGVVVKEDEDCFFGMYGKVYAQEESGIQDALGRTAQFVSLKNHVHQLAEVTFFAFDTWAVTGSYCEECAYGTNCRRVELVRESDKENLPPLINIPEPTPVPSPTMTPVPEKTEAPSATESPLVSPSPTLTASPTDEPTLPPTMTLVPSPTMTSVPEEPGASPAIESPLVSDLAELIIQTKQDLAVGGLRVSTKDNRSVMLRWKANTNADYYRIYRANRKNGTYKLIQMVGKSKSSYVDKKVEPLKRYYYKVTALDYNGGAVVEGSGTITRSICLSGIRTPQIAIKKGQLKSIRYVTVILKKYQGKSADIYISLSGKKFKKLNLVSNKISKYKGKFKIRYVVKGTTIRFKVRTYKKRGGKKWYSNFSKVIKVRV